jgi:hypothetical protein
MPKGSFDLKAWARVGAEHRLTELRQEQQRILATFPELRNRTGSEVGSRRSGNIVRNGRRGRPVLSAVNGVIKPKRTMSAEARAKIAAAQRKRWAKVRRASK